MARQQEFRKNRGGSGEGFRCLTLSILKHQNMYKHTHAQKYITSTWKAKPVYDYQSGKLKTQTMK